MKRIVRAVATSLLLAASIEAAAAKPFKALFPNAVFAKPEAQTMAESFDYRQGDIKLDAIGVTLKVPAAYYLFAAADAKRLMTEVWGNPPEAANGVLGMILPANKTPFDDSWAAVLTFEEDGYVADEDAKNIDTAALLITLQEAAVRSSAERVEKGASPVRLIGWAAPPTYDAARHALTWAKEVEFGGRDVHTLNYSVRTLGRRGVLQTNFIARMTHLDEIRRVVPAVTALAEFQNGFRYADFVAGSDKRAAYGIGGLITGETAPPRRSTGSSAAMLAQVLLLAALAGCAAWWYRGGTFPRLPKPMLPKTTSA